MIFTKEELLDLCNCIGYHLIQQERLYRGEDVFNFKMASMYKSMAHYKRLLKKVKELKKKK